jgi:hypothetical protein
MKRLIVDAETNISKYVEDDEDHVTEIAFTFTDSSRENRRQAYQEEADPLFFKSQRGEATLDEWLAKINEIKQRFPKE